MYNWHGNREFFITYRRDVTCYVSTKGFKGTLLIQTVLTVYPWHSVKNTLGDDTLDKKRNPVITPFGKNKNSISVLPPIRIVSEFFKKSIGLLDQKNKNTGGGHYKDISSCLLSWFFIDMPGRLRHACKDNLIPGSRDKGVTFGTSWIFNIILEDSETVSFNQEGITRGAEGVFPIPDIAGEVSGIDKP